MCETDQIYFRRRAGEEREAARRAKSSEARFIHLELARRYSSIAAESAREVSELLSIAS